MPTFHEPAVFDADDVMFFEQRWDRNGGRFDTDMLEQVVAAAAHLDAHAVASGAPHWRKRRNSTVSDLCTCAIGGDGEAAWELIVRLSSPQPSHNLP